jgi:hypothetical protein
MNTVLVQREVSEHLAEQIDELTRLDASGGAVILSASESMTVSQVAGLLQRPAPFVRHLIEQANVSTVKKVRGIVEVEVVAARDVPAILDALYADDARRVEGFKAFIEDIQ